MTYLQHFFFGLASILILTILFSSLTISISSSSSSSSNNTNTTTTVVDTVATYNKALEAMSQSVRDLLSFEIELPLNNPVFKNLHTNMMLWTELPKEFKLTNLEKIFKILPSYKVNRGVAYQENRWYVEKIVIKHDGKGPIAKITLNPFPSSYSVYSNAVKSYAEAYDQAFKQNTTTENASSTTTSTGTGQARLGRDSTDTNSMACMRGGGYGNSGHGRNFDSCCQKGYAQEGKAYYNWARQYSDVISLLKAMANRFKYYYPMYYNNKKGCDFSDLLTASGCTDESLCRGILSYILQRYGFNV